MVGWFPKLTMIRWATVLGFGRVFSSELGQLATKKQCSGKPYLSIPIQTRKKQQLSYPIQKEITISYDFMLCSLNMLILYCDLFPLLLVWLHIQFATLFRSPDSEDSISCSDLQPQYHQIPLHCYTAILCYSILKIKRTERIKSREKTVMNY